MSEEKLNILKAKILLRDAGEKVIDKETYDAFFELGSSVSFYARFARDMPPTGILEAFYKLQILEAFYKLQKHEPIFQIGFPESKEYKNGHK